MGLVIESLRMMLPGSNDRARDYSSAAGSGCKPYGCSSLQPFRAFPVELALGRPGCKLEDGATTGLLSMGCEKNEKYAKPHYWDYR